MLYIHSLVCQEPITFLLLSRICWCYEVLFYQPVSCVWRLYGLRWEVGGRYSLLFPGIRIRILSYCPRLWCLWCLWILHFDGTGGRSLVERFESCGWWGRGIRLRTRRLDAVVCWARAQWISRSLATWFLGGEMMMMGSSRTRDRTWGWKCGWFTHNTWSSMSQHAISKAGASGHSRAGKLENSRVQSIWGMVEAARTWTYTSSKDRRTGSCIRLISKPSDI